MPIDLSVNLGNILTIVSFIIGGIVFVMSMRSMLGIVEVRLMALEKSNENQNVEIKKLGDILVTLGKYEERFLRVEGMIDELRHGRGMILPAESRTRNS
jgi:hypothetical protein